MVFILATEWVTLSKSRLVLSFWLGLLKVNRQTESNHRTELKKSILFEPIHMWVGGFLKVKLFDIY